LYEDTDADDSASLTVSAIRTGAEDGSGTAGSIGSGLTGTYGTLTLASDGTYTYVADQSAADDLDASDQQQIVLPIQFQMERQRILQQLQ
jgi:VCBS repeat-containing protein